MRSTSRPKPECLVPLDILVREAAGTFISLDGAAGPRDGSAVATNGRLHDAAVETTELT
jgi:histidinol-phosphatase